ATAAVGPGLPPRAARRAHHCRPGRQDFHHRGAHRRGDTVSASRRQLLGLAMSTYAIGDVQGCFDELQQLLEQFKFRKDKDKLWFVGDLVNRGPKSLSVLRLVKDLGNRAIVVLGNHDLHLVSEHEGFDTARKGDTFDDVLGAPDRKELVDWLRTR